MSMSIPHPHRHRHSMWSFPSSFLLPAHQTIVGGRGGRREGRCCCRMLPGFIVRTLNFDGIKLSICVLTYERHEVASGKRQLATAQASHVSHQALPPPPSPSLFTCNRAGGRQRGAKFKMKKDLPCGLARSTGSVAHSIGVD